MSPPASDPTRDSTPDTSRDSISDPTRFDLDARQRAMLAEMGVRVWWPLAEAPPQGQAVAHKADPAAVPAAAANPSPATPVTLPSVAPPVSPPVAPSVAPRVAVPVPVVAKPLVPGVDQMDWAALQASVSACQACALCAQRKNAVFGVGDVQAPWMVIGDAPAEDEDQAGQPFVGPAGLLLDNMMKAVGLSRQGQGASGVYLATATKCRPQGGQNPSADNLATCAPYLARQVALVQPKVILLMGRFAVQSVLQTTEPIGKLRGQVHRYQGLPVVVTYHPAYLLRSPADKAKAWADLVLALKTAQA